VTEKNTNEQQPTPPRQAASCWTDEGTYVIRVNMTPMGNTTLINVEGSPIKSYYVNEEADDMAVCAALSIVEQHIARRLIKAGDGFTVKVEFVIKQPDKEQP
jgi:hypothetical protein